MTKRIAGNSYLDEFADDRVDFAIRLRSKIKDSLHDSTHIVVDIANRERGVQTTERHSEDNGAIFLPMSIASQP